MFFLDDIDAVFLGQSKDSVCKLCSIGEHCEKSEQSDKDQAVMVDIIAFADEHNLPVRINDDGLLETNANMVREYIAYKYNTLTRGEIDPIH